MFGKVNWFYVSCVLGIVLIMFAGNQVVLYSKEEAMINDLRAELEASQNEAKQLNDELQRISFEKEVLVSQKDVEIKNLRDDIDKMRDRKDLLRYEIQALKTQSIQNTQNEHNTHNTIKDEENATQK